MQLRIRQLIDLSTGRPCSEDNVVRLKASSLLQHGNQRCRLAISRARNAARSINREAPCNYCSDTR
jgi:hypothetical protein